MLVRRLARPMLASIFITGGLDALRNPGNKVGAAEPVAQRIADALPIAMPRETEQLVKIDAAVKVGAGSLLALNKMPRLAALALAGSLVPTTIAGHRFWEDEDPAKRALNQIHFFKNLSLLGGLMLAAVDTEGRPSVAYRTRRTARNLTGTSHSVADDAASATRDAAAATRRAAENAAAATRRGSLAVRDSLPIG